jgi:hypothetical protein
VKAIGKSLHHESRVVIPRRHAGRLLAVVAAALVAGVPGGAAAQAAPKPVPQASGADALPGAASVPGGYASWAQLMAVQRRLDSAADRIVAARASGYAGVITAPENREVQVYWKGTVPSSAQTILGDLRRTVPISVLPARYSERELLAESNRLARQPGVTAVAPNADGSGLSLSLRSRSFAEGAMRASTIKVTSTTVATPALASRGNDSPPYWGGARWNGCSTGFAIAIAGVTKMLSAGHCAANGNAAYDGGGDYMGTVSGDNNAYDRLYVNTTSGGRIYDGGVGTGEFSKPVVAATHSYVGDWLCTSGAYSGARCNIQVKAVNQTINVGYTIYQIVRAEQVDHTNAVGNGDSGGPVFSLSTDPNKVIAKGTNTAIDTSTAVACTGVPSGGGRTCAWRFYYVDIVNSLSAYGASLVTG